MPIGGEPRFENCVPHTQIAGGGFLLWRSRWRFSSSQRRQPARPDWNLDRDRTGLDWGWDRTGAAFRVWARGARGTRGPGSAARSAQQGAARAAGLRLRLQDFRSPRPGDSGFQSDVLSHLFLKRKNGGGGASEVTAPPLPAPGRVRTVSGTQPYVPPRGGGELRPGPELLGRVALPAGAQQRACYLPSKKSFLITELYQPLAPIKAFLFGDLGQRRILKPFECSVAF